MTIGVFEAADEGAAGSLGGVFLLNAVTSSQLFW